MLDQTEKGHLCRIDRRWAGAAWIFVLSLILVMQLGSAMASDGSESVGEDPPRLRLSPFLQDLEGPIFMTFAPDGGDGASSDERLFVVERGGRIRIVQDGRLLDEPFLDIRDRVATYGECGLLSMAFPADYSTSRVFYVYYSYDTAKLGDLIPPTVDGEPNGGCDSVVARFSVGDDANQAVLLSEERILMVNQPYNNHNAGQITFGADGYLYIGLGDGGDGGDPHNLAQNGASLLGKMLRVEVGASGQYRIPDTNPFVSPSPVDGHRLSADSPVYRDEIWALGLRNPWRYSFDRQTGDLFVADVGQSRNEEVNFQAASSIGGENYGWDVLEGTECYGASSCSFDGYVLPILEYDHSMGDSITGGYVYRGSKYPELTGIYLFADYKVGKIWGAWLDGSVWQSQLFLDSGLTSAIVSFAEDQDGELYAIDITGAIYEIVDLASLHARPTQLYLPTMVNE